VEPYNNCLEESFLTPLLFLVCVRLSLVDKENFLLIFSSSLQGIVWGANSIIIPIYFKSLGLSPILIGEILGGGILLSSFLSLFWSSLGDAYGRKKFILLSKGISFIAFIILLFSPFAYLFVNQGYGLISALMAEKSKDLDKAMAYRGSLNILFSIAGSLLPIILTYREIILLDSFVVLVSTLLLIPVKEKYKGNGKITLRISSLKLLGKLTTESIIGLGAGILLPMLSLWFNLKFGVSAPSLSPIYTLSEATLALGTYFSPKIGEALGRIRAIFVTHLVAIVFLFLMPFSPTFMIAGIFYILRNTMMNLSGPLMSSFVMRVVKEEERSRVNSMLQLLDAIPRSLGPEVTGYLFSLGNLSFPFFITGSLYLVATFLFYFFFKDMTYSR